MTDPLTARLSELLAKATPRPWRAEERTTYAAIVGGDLPRNGQTPTIAMATISHTRNRDKAIANAALIAEAINALPTLLAERAILIAEREEARALLEPFARVAEVVEQFDPDFPDNGAALRASFDWFDSRLGEHQSLRFSAFRAARAYLTKETSDGQ